ncbi:MAG: hemagglutinin repeat-containing protein [Alphaproteobacteria bacterium]|nr:hemagglutinin repeat-containing protein [Alphaproteobacteria bacterium]
MRVVTIGTSDLVRHTEGRYHKSTSTSDSIERIGSSITAGNDLILSALSPNVSTDGSGNITISGSALTAGHDLDLDAANNVNIVSAADYYHSLYQGKSGGGGFMGGSSIRAERSFDQ